MQKRNFSKLQKLMKYFLMTKRKQYDRLGEEGMKEQAGFEGLNFNFDDFSKVSSTVGMEVLSCWM